VIYSPLARILHKMLESPADFWNNRGANTSSLF
jgi:hypothetical protein